MARATLDLENPPTLTDAELASLDAMTAEDIERNARDDPDNPPMTADELSLLRPLHDAEPLHDAPPPRRRAGGR